MTKSPTLDMGNPTYDIYGKIIGFSPTASTKSPTLEPIKKKCICNYPHLPTTKCPVHDYPKLQPKEKCPYCNQVMPPKIYNKKIEEIVGRVMDILNNPPTSPLVSDKLNVKKKNG